MMYEKANNLGEAETWQSPGLVPLQVLILG